MDLIINPKQTITARLKVPGDKSISHRSLIIGAIARGVTRVHNFLPADDCLNTMRCIQGLGIEVRQLSPTEVEVGGKGLGGLCEPSDILDVGNSGTTIRLLTGLLAGQDFFSVLNGDASIRRRPMERVAEPLRRMGASISGRQGGRLAPLAIQGKSLKAIHYHLNVASAQVKSALLLAGLYAPGETAVTEPVATRDHTERMLTGFGARISRAGLTTVIESGELEAREVWVPGDLSSAAFFLAMGAILPDSSITVENLGLNPTRTGFLEALQQMGAAVTVANYREETGEPVGDVSVQGGDLIGTEIAGEIIPRLIDEIPVLAVVAAAARGETVIRDAAELRVKESDRLHAIATELRKFGVDLLEREDGLIIRGKGNYTGTVCESYGDHRIAMACALMGLLASGRTIVQGADCINISFPGFAGRLDSL